MLLIEKERKTKTAVICPVERPTAVKLLDTDIQERLLEAEGLVVAMGQTAVFSMPVKITKINAGTYFGKGIIEKIKEQAEISEAELVVVDGTLSPVQQRNLEKALNLKVIDRTAVILEIFGRRAQTKEGKLQVELAHLTYQRGRLVRSWTHLERQRGGGGFLGGPGETQIELDRRHLDERILKIKKELEKVRQTRKIQRSARIKVPYPTVALVGYTNAGKSTLFNHITKAQVFAKDMLFATLDPTMRKVNLDGTEVILSDTVGFISNLPHELIMAFRATLEEVLEAEIILHVIDISNQNYKEQRQDVLNVLHELGLDKIEFSKRYMEVSNKIDKISEEAKANLSIKGIPVSAITGEGIDTLLKKLKHYFVKSKKIEEISIDIADGKKLAEIYQTMDVIERKDDDKQIRLIVRK